MNISIKTNFKSFAFAFLSTLVLSCPSLLFAQGSTLEYPHNHNHEGHVMKMIPDPASGKMVARCVHEELPVNIEKTEDIAALKKVQKVIPLQRSTANIIINYSGFTTQAEACFNRAVEIWSNEIFSTVNIVIEAQFTPLGTGVLGSAGPTNWYRDFTNAPQANTFYPVALANALSGTDLNGGSPEVTTSFSSSFSNWYYGLDANPPAGQFDFVSIILHELGHGLGFSSGRSFSGGIGSIGLGNPLTPTRYDRLVVSGSGTAITSLPNPSTDIGGLLVGGNIFMDGPRVKAFNEGNRGRLYDPATWAGGSSYAHWDEGTYNNTPNSLMTPQIAPGEANHNIGNLTRGLFEDLGWLIGLKITQVSIVSNRPSNVLCQGQSIRFTATPINGGASPSYTWRRTRGASTITLQSGTSPTYETSSLQTGDVIFVDILSNDPTVDILTGTSNKITVTLSNSIEASISISNNGSSTISSADNVRLSVSGVGLGLNPDYQWFVNGQLIRTSAIISVPYSSIIAAAGTQPSYTFRVEVRPSADVCTAQDLLIAEVTLQNTVTNLEESLSKDKLVIYPNPASNLLKIEVQEQWIEAWVLKDNLGRTIESRQVANTQSQELSLGAYPAGIYHLEVKTNRQSIHKRVVKTE